ncbi:MAG: hypothetical protein J6Q17_02950, partial [Clostridia bacterium]|nr:hypothetical protein [Clostridia bacterium]
GLFESDTLEDDLRVIARLGVKFLGRASGVWECTGNDALHFARSKALADRVHAQDPEIILQACVFEWITPLMEKEEIPPRVFEAFGKPVEDRCFRFEDARMLPEDGSPPQPSQGTIPDLNRDEARMWFYYRAVSYIDCGYEALHMGQVHLYAAEDRGMKKTFELFGMIRDYAAKHARRHKVLLDAHTHGVAVDGRLLFDYHAMPFTRAPLEFHEGKRLVLVREGFSEGGENPNGWSGDEMPYLMEYDNWCGREYEDESRHTRRELSMMQWWGYDQIAYFAHQPAEVRDHFIEYTYRWTQVNNPHAFFEIPFRRTLGNAPVKMIRGDDGREGWNPNYQINDKSEACPLGFGQEAAVKACWDDGDRLREAYANPEHLIRYGCRDERDPETGYRLPEKVVVFGSFQPYVGAVENDSNSEVTRMYYVGNGEYALTVVIPFAGEYSWAVSTYGTLSAVYGAHSRRPYSGGCGESRFATKRDNSVVRFRFRFMDGEARAEVAE